MKNYKQWHDEQGRFHNETQIHFCQANMKHQMSLSEVLRQTTDSAVEDYSQRGMPWNFLEINDIAILVSRTSYRIHKMPEANEDIVIDTWEEKPEALQLTRSYEITTPEGELLITGDSRWICVNLATRKIMRTADFTLRPNPEIQTEHDCIPPGKIAVPENLVQLDERKIRFSEIDGNGHMDNSRYAEYTIDSLPEQYQQKEFTDMRMNYSKEAVLGDTLQILGSFDDAAKKIVVIGKKAETAETCFECELFYK